MFDPISPYVFIIDTDHYAGNFERQMCAYLTGRVGECGVGYECQEMFEQECQTSFHDDVTDQADEHGVRRPCTMYPTVGWFNDGMGGQYKDDVDPAEVAKKYKKACKDANHADDIWQGQKYPAYLSVAILFENKPSKEQIDVMKERAIKFTTLKFKYEDYTKIKILGYRLLKVEIQTTSIPLS